MLTTTRRKSSGSTGPSNQSGRESSVGKQASSRARFDPSLIMSSNAADAEASRSKGADFGPRRKSVDELRAYERAARRNKSTDRLHRNGESSTNLAGKRSKSQTHLAMLPYDEPWKCKDSNKQRGHKDDSEDGWTSASATETPSDSAQASLSNSPIDEGLVLGFKKRSRSQQPAPTQLPRGPSTQALDTPRATAAQMNDEPQPISTAELLAAPTQSANTRPAILEKEDTSRTLGDNDDEQASQPNPGPTSSLIAPEIGPADSQVHALNRKVANLRLMADSTYSSVSSDNTLAHESRLQVPTVGMPETPQEAESAKEPSSLSVNTSTPAQPSAASNRTLRNSMPTASSPVSVRSRSSIYSNLPHLFPRDSHGIVPPKLDTHNALAGALGARHEDRGDGLEASTGRVAKLRHSLPASASEPVGLDGIFPDSQVRMSASGSSRKKASMSSMNESGIMLPSPSPSIGNVASAATTRGVNNLDSLSRMHRSSQSSMRESLDSSGVLSPDRRRTTSTQSLTASDAAKLTTKLRLARDSLYEHSTANALRSASISGFWTRTRGQNPRLEKYNKPVISKFVKNLSEGPVSIPVTKKSVFSKEFSHPIESKSRKNDHRQMLRYVMGYGLSGPPVEKSKLSDALLGPSLDMDDFQSSWAPALANAAGLGSRPSRQPARHFGPEFGLGPHDADIAVNGPNFTPLHLVHGLTTTSPDAFPLDPSDVPALQEGGDLFDPNTATSPHGAVKYVDPSLIRAIAMTSQAISTHRAHIVTRRYTDPMRESLERMARSSGKWELTPPQAPSNTLMPRIMSLWGGRRTAPTNPGPHSERPGLQRRQTTEGSHRQHPGHLHSRLAGQLYNLVDAAEHPVRSLKRVWSGGFTRGGLTALTRTDEERH